MLVRRPRGLVAIPTRMSSAGKNATKRLYATACAIVFVRGKTRPNTPNARFARAAEAIMSRHYTCAPTHAPVRTTPGRKLFLSVGWRESAEHIRHIFQNRDSNAQERICLGREIRPGNSPGLYTKDTYHKSYILSRPIFDLAGRPNAAPHAIAVSNNISGSIGCRYRSDVCVM